MTGVSANREGAITTITLDRPEVLNAFDATVAAGVAEAIRAAADDTSCRVIVLTGAGRSFCAGADLTHLKDIVTTRDRHRASALVSSGAGIVRAIVSAPKPVIAVGGWDEIRFHKPVRPGDELWLEVTWTAKRRSESKRDRGIVTATMKLFNQDDEVVLSQKNTIFMRVRNPD